MAKSVQGECVHSRRGQSQIEFDPDLKIGMRVRHRRWMLGMPRHHLADHAAIELELLNALERDLMPFRERELTRIAEVLKVPVSYFLTGIDGTDPEPFQVACIVSLGERLVRHSDAVISANERKSLPHAS